MIEDYQKFLNDFDTFKKNDYLVPNEQYFKLVQKNHARLRKHLGDISVEYEVKLDDTQTKANKTKGMPIIKELLGRSDYGCGVYSEIDDEKFLYPYVRIDDKRVYKTTKYLDSIGCDHPKKAKLYADLGQLWAKARTTKQEYIVKVDTSAMGFLRLGHYGADKLSCFASGQGNENECHKFYIGQTPDTFVITIRTNKEDSKVQFRCWGWFHPVKKNPILNITNCYYSDGTKAGNILACLDNIAKELMKVEADPHKLEDRIQEGEDIPYINESGGLTYYVGNQEPDDYEDLTIDADITDNFTDPNHVLEYSWY